MTMKTAMLSAALGLSLLGPISFTAEGKDRYRSGNPYWARDSRVDKEWSKNQKEIYKNRRKALKARELDERRYQRAREKNRREAAREYQRDLRDSRKQFRNSTDGYYRDGYRNLPSQWRYPLSRYY